MSFKSQARSPINWANGPTGSKSKRPTGSTILWIGIHMIDLMLFASGRKYTHATSFMGRTGFPNLGDMETTTAPSFRLDNGGTATLHMDYSACRKRTLLMATTG